MTLADPIERMQRGRTLRETLTGRTNHDDAALLQQRWRDDPQLCRRQPL